MPVALVYKIIYNKKRTHKKEGQEDNSKKLIMINNN